MSQTKTKSLSKVEKVNAIFQAMTPAEKRVAIAKDVLKHLEAKKIKPTSGTYVNPDLSNKTLKNKFSGRMIKDVQLQEVYSNVNSCKVCALGAMFFCAVKVANNLNIQQHWQTSVSTKILNREVENTIYYKDMGYSQSESVFKYMKRFFTKHQLDLIETAFERFCLKSNNTNVLKAIEMFKPEVSLHNRMKAIMQNIIKNKGTFVVPKKSIEV